MGVSAKSTGSSVLLPVCGQLQGIEIAQRLAISGAVSVMLRRRRSRLQPLGSQLHSGKFQACVAEPGSPRSMSFSRLSLIVLFVLASPRLSAQAPVSNAGAALLD